MKNESEIIKGSASLGELQNALLIMMIDIRDVCKRHNIKYSLGAGTALGAVRHQGFIPWDDDVDLVFLRPEYEKFLLVAEKELEPLGYYVQKEFTKTWPMTYTKIRKNGTAYIEKFTSQIKGLHQGIFIDIFPIDNAYDNRFLQEIQWRAYQLVCAKGLKARGYKADSISKRIAMIISGFFNEAKLIGLCKAKNQSHSKHVNIFLGGATGKDRNIHERTVFDEYIDIAFENEQFSICKEYDKYLRKTYGDYLKLPPKNERVAAIHALYVSLNESYEDIADLVREGG